MPSPSRRQRLQAERIRTSGIDDGRDAGDGEARDATAGEAREVDGAARAERADQAAIDDDVERPREARREVGDSRERPCAVLELTRDRSAGDPDVSCRIVETSRPAELVNAVISPHRPKPRV